MGCRKISVPTTLRFLPFVCVLSLWGLFLPLSQKAVGRAFSEIFTDVTVRAGITWVHFNGESEDRFLIEAVCGGVAFLDFDRDGLLDMYFVNGGETPKGKCKSPVRNALYRNLGDGTFDDVALKAGVDRIDFFGMGVAVADYDNDGFPDLFVTGYPSSNLFRNNGNGTFTDVTAKASVKNDGEWAASAAWFDYDRDGFLDLFVTNYVTFSLTEPRRCEYSGIPVYCGQTAYEGRSPTLYHNNGDGTFKDVSRQSGIKKHVGRAFGVVTTDANEDGWPDVVVACDASPNWLLMNQKDGTFKDFALDAELAFSPDGIARAGMGVDAGDVNADGKPDFVVTNFHSENHALYLNTGAFPFEEWTTQSGLAGFTKSYVGWGTHFIDYNNDGALDLLIVNGHLNSYVERTRKDVQYRQLPLLLANNGKGVFQNMQGLAGPVFNTGYLARGMATGDFDNDGDTDAIFVCLNDKPVLLRNNVGQNQVWIGFQLTGTVSNRDAIGARLTVRFRDRRFVRWITGGASFLASSDKRIVVGLEGGAPSEAISVDVQWPNGTIQQVRGLQPNHYHEIVERAEGAQSL